MKRYGKIYIGLKKDDHNKQMEYFSTIFGKMKFFPTKVEYIYSGDYFEMFGYSPLFDEVIDGIIIPTYNIIYEETFDEVKVEKI